MFVNDIGNFFIKKVDVIWIGLDIVVGNIYLVDEMFFWNFEIYSFFYDFRIFIDKEVSSFIIKVIKKICLLDFMLIIFVVECFDVLFFVFIKMINLLF